jgi:hypothetical protein
LVGECSELLEFIASVNWPSGLYFGVPRVYQRCRSINLKISGDKTVIENLKSMALASLVNQDYALILNVGAGFYNLSCLSWYTEVMRTVAFSEMS